MDAISLKKIVGYILEVDGYILEVDLEHPDKLHEMHNNYPLAPEELGINHNILKMNIT